MSEWTHQGAGVYLRADLPGYRVERQGRYWKLFVHGKQRWYGPFKDSVTEKADQIAAKEAKR